MWGRANMAAVILLLGWVCVFARGEASNAEMSLADVEAEAILEKATTWLWSQRDKDAGWGNDTHRVLLALRLGNLTRDDNIPPAPVLELQLSAKQMELEIVLLLWRHREVGFSPVRLARYTLALNALCMDPRQFHGHDLIGTLQHHEPPTDYEFAVATLAACSAQAHVRKRQIRRLLDIANAAQDHNVDTVAMVILALRCIVQDHRHRNLHHFVRKPSIGLAHQQRLDGSFGDLHTTALAMQALEEVENEPANNWNRSAALAWLSSRQRQDGSFDGDVRTTAEAVLGVAPRGLATIRALDCGQGLTDSSPPRLTTSNDITAPENHSEVLIALTSGSNTSALITEPAGTSTPVLVNVTYTLWVGSNVNETYSLTLTAPKNETFYGVMVMAAEMSTHFEFAASEWPNGHYVHTLAGYKEEPLSYHYWLLYRLPSPPEPASPPGNQLVAPGGVDDLQISEGEHYLFWYKKL
ncbi:uncharacterized protein CG3556 [Cephus cinctus]|uniref:Uncharacterized protein CG3556 n=1 Tax=Cephus cinctus TaxID=211228 RepID=A0AAJ7BRQ0_CEPCN|nr:uncharacterized protein CG3556 [Cephus cinctus]